MPSCKRLTEKDENPLAVVLPGLPFFTLGTGDRVHKKVALSLANCCTAIKSHGKITGSDGGLAKVVSQVI